MELLYSRSAETRLRNRVSSMSSESISGTSGTWIARDIVDTKSLESVLLELSSETFFPENNTLTHSILRQCDFGTLINN